MTYEFSRVNPPRVLIPVNNNAVGAHNELLPTNEYEIKPPVMIKRVKKSIIHQRETSYEDPNIAKETLLHPAYMSYESDSIQGKSIINTGPLSF